MTAPWARDTVAIDADTVRALLRAQFPRFAEAPLAFLHEGWDSRAFEVGEAGGEWIFRFPKRESVHARLATEIALLPPLAPRLPLPVPKFQFLGRPSPEFPYRFVGYRKLVGAIAMLVDPDELDAGAVGRQLGRFLAALHAFPLEQAERLGVRADTTYRDLPGLRVEAAARLDAPAVREALGEETARRAAELLALPPGFTGAVRLVHNDLAGEHIILSSPAEVSGVIDWGDVMLGDPAVDLAGLYHLGGDPLLLAALAEYPYVDAGTIERARFLSWRRAIEDVAYGVEMAQPAYIVTAKRVIGFSDGRRG